MYLGGGLGLCLQSWKTSLQAICIEAFNYAVAKIPIGHAVLPGLREDHGPQLGELMHTMGRIIETLAITSLSGRSSGYESKKMCGGWVKSK